MDRPSFDLTCEKLFSVLLVTNRKLRFNELHRNINDIGLKMSKPTLIEHLNHLKKQKLVIRKREGKQNVTYEVNWEKIQELTKVVKTRRALKRIIENKESFKSVPIDEQVTYVHNILALRNLHQLKLLVLGTIDPSKNFEHSLQYIITHRFFEFYKTWLIENCNENKIEYRQKALSTIEDNIKRYEDILFERVPLPP